MAGFGRNGSRSSAEALATADRHSAWITLRGQGLNEAEIAIRYGVTQQAVSKVLLKYARNRPAQAAQELRRAHVAQVAAMRESALHALEEAQSPAAKLAAVGMLVKIEEREAKLLGLDAPVR
jgi:predicted transcriptional regulator